MGIVESGELHVNFNHPNLLYLGGEQIQGNVSYQNFEEKKTVHAIYIEFTGDIHFLGKKEYAVSDPIGLIQHEGLSEHRAHTFMKFHIYFVQSQNGRHGVTLNRGQHSWQFHFVLPDYLPPTILPIPEGYPSVRYFARIVIIDRWHATNVARNYALTILPRVNIFHTPGGQEHGLFQNQNRQNICINGSLSRGGVVPGDKLYLHINIQNPKQIVIKNIEAILIQRRQLGSSDQTSPIFRLNLPEIADNCCTSLQKSIEISLPNVCLSPTYAYSTQSNVGLLAVIISYTLLLDVKVRGIFCDFQIALPVIVGTEPLPGVQQQQQLRLQEQQQQFNVPFEMPMANAPAMEYNDLPPSYDSVVTIEKT